MLTAKFKSLFLAAAATIMAGALIIFPQESFDASIRGLNMWWEIVFPSLLPFFIIAETLIGFGVVTLIGVLLEPLMRPLFKVPGVGGFVWAMGMASGFPSGAKFTARMRQEKQLTRIEAERLVSFTNSSNPLFIFGAVSVGFFHNTNLGILLALSHYLGNIFVGIIMRFYGREEETKPLVKKKPLSIKQAFAEMHRTRLKENRPLGKLLGDAVVSSIQTLLMIGGFIILFSVVNKLLFHMHVTGFLANAIQIMLQILQFPLNLSMPFIAGIFEITLGSQMTSGIEEASLMQQAIVVSFILGFSGFSVQAQVASIIADTDIRFFPFFIARIMHGILAGFFAFVLWEPLYNGFTLKIPSNSLPVYGHSEGGILTLYEIMTQLGPLITIISLLLYTFILAKRLLKE
ncbi:sporulation integral membrane protein YlbJ [Peribacillus psychrosaccharolyticus]|uniref:Sporulation integral membrane protein YlbJ n=1 Tax=Peribacillus psychrosaccharolyticus TaxID=1407 RepID=A0A974S1K0_PERPY|nr:sporulation integral membrane protein YlbJ [Peribacillus psychrosaccharolyticus]MEC2053680.1 sporulation integral membrane protein YlbJ [Peribacillus psychrosaccharolyticus]MED3742705.1 sporulation integral membrane protein YlbJ [Peribacillus psychrosaccharolyticus]QQT01644.1 sporulation integral membrane protein YlbJ [Peribacillus psychrosaccharolyticus]